MYFKPYYVFHYLNMWFSNFVIEVYNQYYQNNTCTAYGGRHCLTRQLYAYINKLTRVSCDEFCFSDYMKDMAVRTWRSAGQDSCSLEGNDKLSCYCHWKFSKAPVTPNVHTSVLKLSQRAVGSPRKTHMNIKFASYSMYSCTQRHPSGFIASMTLIRCACSCCSVFTACSWCAHSAHTAFSRRP